MFRECSHLSDVLHVLQLPELAERVVPEGLVERGVAVLVRDVEVAAVADEKTDDLGVLPLNGQVQGRLQVHVLEVHVGAAFKRQNKEEKAQYA